MCSARVFFGCALLLVQLNAFALSLDDFLPDFLTGKQAVESANATPEIAFKIPAASQKRNASSATTWYCERVDGAFCVKQNASQEIAQAINGSETQQATVDQGANSSYINRNSNNYNSNAINNFNITNSNQTALQAYAPQLNNYSIEDRIRNGFAIPIKPSQNTELNLSPNQVQFNMQY